MIRIGTAGVPLGTIVRDTQAGIKYVREIGLDAMEVEFVRGVYLTENAAGDVGRLARELDVSLSVHAPYYINLNSVESEKIEASKKRIIDSARIAGILGARIVVFHPGFYGKVTPEETLQKIQENIIEVRETLDKEGNNVLLGPETTGKKSQFGTLEELMAISQTAKRIMPAIDFGHLHARSNGGLKTKQDFEAVFDLFGRQFKEPMHIHMAGVKYSEKGELEHLEIGACQPDYKHLAGILKERKIEATVISESPNIEKDALTLKKMLE
ncbi:MAG: TIM barrel protein [Candidatus Altiarchaeota archaeon]|nr:TIM barrel protein [Candidatus Altiarchaeota archaeon]